MFSLFCYFVMEFGFCLMISRLFCFLCFTSTMSFTGLYTKGQPNFNLTQGFFFLESCLPPRPANQTSTHAIRQ